MHLVIWGCFFQRFSSRRPLHIIIIVINFPFHISIKNENGHSQKKKGCLWLLIWQGHSHGLNLNCPSCINVFIKFLALKRLYYLEKSPSWRKWVTPGLSCAMYPPSLCFLGVTGWVSSTVSLYCDGSSHHRSAAGRWGIVESNLSIH